MKLQVVVENNTYIDQYYLGEPGLCFYIEEEDKRILFDTGYSDICLKNAKALGIDLSELTHIVLSHGHNDHTRGLRYIAAQYDLSQVIMVTHPASLMPKREGEEEIGAPYNEAELQSLCQYQPSIKPVHITDKLVFLGEIPQTVSFEKREQIGERKTNTWEKDEVIEDSALVYHTEEGMMIITGCSHSGICNIIEYARKVCDEERVYGIIGGFHLMKKDNRLEHTIGYLSSLNLKKLYPCHCVSFQAKAELNSAIPVEEVGVGLTLEMK